MKHTQRFYSTPLWIAADGGHLEVVKLLCDLGANQFARSVDGTSPLEAAVRNGHDEVASFLKVWCGVRQVISW